MLYQKLLIFIFNKFDYNYFRKNKIIGLNTQYKILPGSGIDLNKYKFKKYIKKTNINFSFISRLLIEKGILDLFDAIKIIKKKYSNVTFKIIGNLDHMNKSSINLAKLNSMINADLIIYSNFTNDVINKINETDCVILPSYREGSSRILLETAALVNLVLLLMFLGAII